MIISMEGHDNRWTYFDNIDEVEKRKFELLQPELLEMSQRFTHIKISDTWKCQSGKPDSKEVVEIHAIKSNKEHILILTDGHLYLLNDQGQTIERIN